MLIELLSRNGTASVEHIAQAILDRDPTQIEYFSIRKRMPTVTISQNLIVMEWLE
jgi:hypothetical protein